MTRHQSLPWWQIGMLAALLALVLVGCAGQPAAAPTPTPRADGVTLIEPPHAMSDFTLTNQTGGEAHLSDWRDHLVLIAFGYTHCPDVCPLTLAHFKMVKEALDDQADRVRFVWISVDGARDTPTRIGEYLTMFDSTFIGLTGDESDVRQVITEYGGTFIIQNAGGLKDDYPVDHTASKFLLDGQGRWLRTYAYSTEVPVIVADIQALLASAATTTG